MANDQLLKLGESSFAALTSASAGEVRSSDRGQAGDDPFGCYRASEANDPETFITGAAATLACYPEAIVRDVCDPVRGLPAHDEWLPSIARVRVECERRMQPVRDQERRERIRGATLSRRPSSKAAIGSPEHQRVVEGYQAVVARLEPAPVAVAPLDARTAPTPELRAQAVAYHEARLEELASSYASADYRLPGGWRRRRRPGLSVIGEAPQALLDQPADGVGAALGATGEAEIVDPLEELAAHGDVDALGGLAMCALCRMGALRKCSRCVLATSGVDST